MTTEVLTSLQEEAKAELKGVDGHLFDNNPLFAAEYVYWQAVRNCRIDIGDDTAADLANIKMIAGGAPG